MIPHSEITDFLQKGLNTEFFRMFDTYQPATGEGTITDIASLIPSTTNVNKYAALGTAPMPERFKGELKKDGIVNKITWTLENQDWATSLDVLENDLDDDQYGQIITRCQELGIQFRRWMDYKVFTSIHDGGTNLCYDGKALFADDHPIGGSTFDNNLSTDLSKSNLQDACSQMEGFVDDRGLPAGIVADTLLVHPKLYITAQEIVNSTTVVTRGTDNVLVPSANGAQYLGLKVIKSPFLTSATEWYVACTRYPTKPIVVQERKPVATDMKDETFDKKQYTYKADWRGNFGYYDPRLIVRGKA